MSNNIKFNFTALQGPATPDALHRPLSLFFAWLDSEYYPPGLRRSTSGPTVALFGGPEYDPAYTKPVLPYTHPTQLSKIAVYDIPLRINKHSLDNSGDHFYCVTSDPNELDKLRGLWGKLLEADYSITDLSTYNPNSFKEIKARAARTIDWHLGGVIYSQAISQTL